MEHLRGVWGVSPSYVMAVGDNGSALLWDGTDWKATPTGITTDLRSVWGRSDKEFWAVGTGGVSLFWNGSTWVKLATPVTENLDRVRGYAGGSQVLAVGDRGTLMRWQSGAWASLSTGQSYSLHGAFVLNETNAFLAGDGGSILNIAP